MQKEKEKSLPQSFSSDIRIPFKTSHDTNGMFDDNVPSKKLHRYKDRIAEKHSVTDQLWVMNILKSSRLPKLLQIFNMRIVDQFQIKKFFLRCTR